MSKNPAIRPDPRNANKGTQRGEGMLERSLQSYGAGRSVLIDKNGVLIAGNKTWQKAQELGIPTKVVETDGHTLIAVQRTDLDVETDTAAMALGVVDNRASQVGLDWDIPNLQQVFDAGVDGNEFWFPEELSALFAEAEPETTAGLTDPDAVPEPPKEPITKPGDLWLLGEHKLYCGDSTSPDHIDRVLGADKPAMVFADPPYGIEIVSGKGLGSANGAKPFGSAPVRGTDGASNIIAAGQYEAVIGDDTTDTAVAAYGLAASLLPKAVHIWWGGNYYANMLPPSSCWIVWDKDRTGNFADAELAWTNQPTAVRIFKHTWNGLIKESERGEKRVHPTQKPVALAEWCFNEYGKLGGVVFDPFAGSGIAIIAGERTGRSVRAIEMSPAYCDVIVNRWQDFTGQTATLERRAD